MILLTDPIYIPIFLLLFIAGRAGQGKQPGPARGRKTRSLEKASLDYF
jgi:hypothetical protein